MLGAPSLGVAGDAVRCREAQDLTLIFSSLGSSLENGADGREASRVNPVDLVVKSCPCFIVVTMETLDVDQEASSRPLLLKMMRRTSWGSDLLTFLLAAG